VSGKGWCRLAPDVNKDMVAVTGTAT
jgi:hypothetical protein